MGQDSFDLGTSKRGFQESHARSLLAERNVLGAITRELQAG
jgi:hypothetical protein